MTSTRTANRFTEAVHIKAFCILGGGPDSSPSKVRLYVNWAGG